MRIRIPKVSADKFLQNIIGIADALFEDLDTELSVKARSLLLNGKYEELASLEVDPSSYTCAASFRDDYQVVSLLRKAEFLPSEVDKDAVALKGFLAAEKACSEMNDKLLSKDSSEESWNRESLLSGMAREISLILGNCPSVSDLQCSFGPGSTSTTKGGNVSVVDKIQSVPSCTLRAVPHLDMHWREAHALREVYMKSDLSLKPISVQNFNELSFVPKDFRKSRAICIEPTWNTYFQKGIGRHMKRRLAYFGNDLSKQQDRNAEYARRGSIDGSFATIDLSAASDSISYMLVAELLPLPWFDLLDCFRSPFTKLPNGSLIENEKFSSMGNGYTFELETLIFLSLVRVLAKRHSTPLDHVMAFGDDIIVPTELAKETIRSLELIGFSVNTEKTFLDGPFRESCGKDYFHGQLVRPYFIKKAGIDEKCYYAICNGLRRVACSHMDGLYGDPRYKRAWIRAHAQISRRCRFYGPRVLGDSVIQVPRSERPLIQRTKFGITTVKTLIPIQRKKKLPANKYQSSVAASLLGQQSVSSIRRTLIGYKVKPVSIPDWDWTEGAWCNW